MESRHSISYGKTITLIAISVVMFLGGIFDHWYFFDSTVQKTSLEHVVGGAVNIFVCILTFHWYCKDATEYSFHRTAAWNIGIILVTVVIVLPWYLFKSRGFKNGIWSFGQLLAFVLAGMILPYVAGLLLPYVILS